MPQFTFQAARAFMAGARDASAGRPICNNTRMYERHGEHAPGGTYYAIRFHHTDVVEIYSNGTYGVRHSGWTTLTTRQRIESFAPVRVIGKLNDSWFLRLRPTANDPEPPRNNRIEVRRPFRRPPEPGDEPRSEDFGECWAGQRLVRGVMRTAWVGDSFGEPRANDRPKLYDSSGELDRLSGARRMLAWLEQVLPRGGSVMIAVERPGVEVIDYGESSWRRTPVGEREPRTTYKHCKHCAAFQSATRQRAARQDLWDLYWTNIEEYGSEGAWREAWREDRRRVIEANRTWGAWNARNLIEIDGLVRVDHRGYPLQSEVRSVRHLAYRRRIADNRQLRESRQRAIAERQFQRWQRGMQRKREKTMPFEARAALVARELASINARLATTTEPES